MRFAMDPLTAVVIILCLVVGAGGGVGIGVAIQGDQSAEALEAQAKTLEALSEGQAKLAEQASKPVVLDAELRADLAKVPVQCRRADGGDPMSAACAWATCLQFGQSSAQRPECRAVEAMMVDEVKARGSAP